MLFVCERLSNLQSPSHGGVGTFKFTIMAKEKCIMCGKECIYDVHEDISHRYGYVEGAGQLCYYCYKAEVPIPKEVIKSTPNDQELGSIVRKMYHDIISLFKN